MRPRSLFESAGAALAPLLTREQAKALADRVLAMSTADETRVTIDSAWEGNTRFAGGEITTSGEAVNTTVGVSTPLESGGQPPTPTFSTTHRCGAPSIWRFVWRDCPPKIRS